MVGAFGAGAAWVGVFASLGAGTQSAAPAWVRARAVAMSFVDRAGRLAVGSVLWGAGRVVAGHARRAARVRGDVPGAARAASARARAPGRRQGHHAGRADARALGIAVEPEPDDGPVLIQIEYRIDPDEPRRVPARDARDRPDAPAQRREQLARVPRPRARTGLSSSATSSSSWAEYVRLRSRMTIADRHVQQEIERHQREGVPDPRVALPRRRPARRRRPPAAAHK